MISEQSFTIIGAIFGLLIGNAALIIPLFLWNRSESRSDTRMMLALIEGIQSEIKDFHGRLCIIEERNRK